MRPQARLAPEQQQQLERPDRAEARLDEARYLDLVRQVKPHTNGECFLVLDSGAQVKVSRSYRDVVARFVH
jgi:hypothetical protein